MKKDMRQVARSAENVKQTKSNIKGMSDEVTQFVKFVKIEFD